MDRKLDGRGGGALTTVQKACAFQSLYVRLSEPQEHSFLLGADSLCPGGNNRTFGL